MSTAEELIRIIEGDDDCEFQNDELQLHSQLLLVLESKELKDCQVKEEPTLPEFPEDRLQDQLMDDCSDELQLQLQLVKKEESAPFSARKRGRPRKYATVLPSESRRPSDDCTELPSKSGRPRTCFAMVPRKKDSPRQSLTATAKQTRDPINESWLSNNRKVNFDTKQLQKKKKTETLIKNVVEPVTLLCGLCKYTTQDASALAPHVDSHRAPAASDACGTCGTCGDTYDTWPELLAHRVRHVPPGQAYCHLCPRRRPRSDKALEFHYYKKHFDGEFPGVRCPLCPVVYRGLDDWGKLRKHIRGTHSANRYYCDDCTYSARTRALLVSHISRAHSPARPLRCDQCDFTTRHKQGLKSHVARRHAAGAGRVCGPCGRVLPAGGLAAHRELCAAPALCAHCGKTVPRKNLHRHLVQHDPTPRHTCDACGAAYRTRGGLAAHRARHAGLRPHVCAVCRRAFAAPSSLVKHRRVHTGEKPYVCRVCGRGFTGNNNLKVHMKVHGEYLVQKRQPRTEEVALPKTVSVGPPKPV